MGSYRPRTCSNVSIADLKCLVDILDNPIVFLHYLYERGFLQKSINLIGDEMDLLGLYLETGFNLANAEMQADLLEVTGQSASIDAYYESRGFGVNLSKSTMKLGPLFREMIDQLCQLKPEGWTLVGVHLLNSSNYSEQVKLEKKLSVLRRMVRKNFRDPDSPK